MPLEIVFPLALAQGSSQTQSKRPLRAFLKQAIHGSACMRPTVTPNGNMVNGLNPRSVHVDFSWMERGPVQSKRSSVPPLKTQCKTAKL